MEKRGDETLLDKLDIRTYKIRRLRKSLSTGFDYRFNENHVITFNAIGNWRQDWENRYSSKITKLSSGKANNPTGQGWCRQECQARRPEYDGI